MNGMYDDDLVEMMKKYNKKICGNHKLPCATLYGGIAFICSSRLSPSVVHHSATDGLLLGGVASSDVVQDVKSKELSCLDQLWSPTRVPFQAESNLLLARWKKNCWNIPFSSVNVVLQGEMTIEDIVRHPSLRKLCDEIMDETIAIANADLASRGEPPPPLLGHKEVSELLLLNPMRISSI
jgi:ketopantoate reductase